MATGHASPPRGSRSVAIDLVRVVGVVAVVLGHVAGGPPEGPDNLVRILTYSWHVPLFFFLTGYLWSPGRSLGGEVRKRAVSLLLPYACWLAIIGVPYFAYISLRDGVVPGAEILHALWGGALMRGVLGPFWFLPELFLVAVLRRALDAAPASACWAIAVVGTLAGTLWGPQLATVVPLDLSLTGACFLYALAGETARRVRPGPAARTVIGSALLAGAAALLLTGLVAPLDIKLGDFGTPIASTLVAVAICTGIVWIAETALDQRAPAWGPFVTELATVSVVVLLTHAAFMYVTAGVLPPWAVLTVALTGSWALGWAVHRTPVSLALAGVPRIGGPRSRPVVRSRRQPGAGSVGGEPAIASPR